MPDPATPAPEGRLRKIIDWARGNPILASLGSITGFAASIIGVVEGLPPAWDATMKMAGRPACFFYADVYHYADGSFTRTDRHWHEAKTDAQFDFGEVRRSRDFLLLLNQTRRLDPRWPTMLVRLPVCGGTAQWTYENPEHWTDLFEVWR